MPITDKETLLSDSQTMVGVAEGADVASTHTYDCGVATPNRGYGTPLLCRSNVADAFISCSQFKVSVKDCDTEGGTYAIILSGPNTARTAGLTEGVSLMSSSLPQEHRRFLQFFYDVTGTTEATNGGSVTSMIAPA